MFNEKETIEKIVDKAIKINSDKWTIFVYGHFSGHVNARSLRLQVYKDGWDDKKDPYYELSADTNLHSEKYYQKKLEEMLKFLENMEEKENDNNRK